MQILPIITSLVVSKNFLDKEDSKLSFYKESFIQIYFLFFILIFSDRIIYYQPKLYDLRIMLIIPLIFIFMRVIRREIYFLNYLILYIYLLEKVGRENIREIGIELFITALVFIIISRSFEAVKLRLRSESTVKYFSRDFIEILILFIFYISFSMLDGF